MVECFLANCFSFVAVFFDLGDLSIIGTAGLDSTLVTLGPGMLDTVSFELRTFVGLVVVIFSMNHSKATAV